MNITTSLRGLATALLTAAALLPSAASASLANGSFNQGLTGWTTLGDVAVQGHTLVLTTASAIFEDDAPLAAGYFNVSGQEAGGIGIPGGLEDFVGVPLGSLDPDPIEHTVALYEGSAVRQSVWVNAGDTLSFRWNLLTADQDMPDAALLFLGSQAPVTLTTADMALDETDLLADGQISVRQTGYQLYSHTFTQAGTVMLAWAVADHGDYIGSSQLMLQDIAVTAVPEPGTVTMVLAGLAMMLFIAYRQGHQ